MSKKRINWNEVKLSRSAASRVLPSLLDIPVIKSHHQLLLNMSNGSENLLDIGANDRGLCKILENNGKEKIKYFSYDIDRSLFHDFYEIENIDKKFEIITIFEVIEHMPVEDVKNLLKNVKCLLEANGVLIISTPNVYHPVRFWRDCTHITPFAYDEIVGMLLMEGFTHFDVYRTKNNMKLKDWVRYWLYKPLIKLLGIDFATGIVVVAHFRS